MNEYDIISYFAIWYDMMYTYVYFNAAVVPVTWFFGVLS